MNTANSQLTTATVFPEPLRSSVVGVPEHPLRFTLHNELHAGPYELLAAPVQASHLALLCGNDATDEERRLIAQLCDRYGVNPPASHAVHFSAKLGSIRLKWVRHGEFSTYTFFHFAPFESPFADPAINYVPKEWLASLPGEVLVATHLALDHASRPKRELRELGSLFASNTVIGSAVSAGSAVAWTDYRIDSDGFGRILVQDVSLRRRQAGRLVQRLLEIETYRMLALLPLPLVRKYGPELARFDKRLAELTEGITALECLEDEQRLLDELMRLAAEVERISAATNSRIRASLEYYHIVQSRIAGLREQRIQGLQTFHEFMEQRLSSAIDNCQSVHDNLEALSMRLARASDLLRTRVNITMEGQTRDLLRSMDKRAHMQLHLQQTVEGLSVVVLSYYLVGLVGYGFQAMQAAGIALNVDLATGLSIPVVVGVVFFAVRRLRRLVSRNHDQEPTVKQT